MKKNGIHGLVKPVWRKMIHILSPYYGSNRISRWVRKRIEYKSIQELVGFPLAGLAFFGAVVMPQAQAAFYSAELYFDTQYASEVNAAVTEQTFRWPMASFGISQYFHAGHRGIDLRNARGTPIYPITDGTVTYAGNSLWGYGKHIIVTHNDELQSLYAHLSTVLVSAGDTVAKSTQLGAVGATGWATGYHLHLEILLNGAQSNPLEILPEISRQTGL